jgi:hypothetical protein
MNRLEELITVLQSLKPEQLTLETWACNGQADPAGHYAIARPNEGLRLSGPIPSLDFDTCVDLGLLPDILFENLKGVNAVIKFFELTEKQYNLIFDASFYDTVTLEDCIERIRFVIENPNKDWWSCLTLE